MADFAPPSGPPPPQVPEGWKAIFNDQYQTWFYVNIHTKKSTWDKPTGPAPRPDDDAPPGGPPPSYSAGPGSHNVSDVKRRSFESNNPYNKHGQESDAELARRLQAEEDGRRDRGQADSYYNSGGGGASPNPPGLQGGYPGAPSPTSPGAGSNGKRGLFSKLMGKQSGGGSNSPYPQQPAGYQQGYQPQGPGYGPPGGGYGGYGGPPMGPGGYGGGYGPPGGGYGYGQPQYIQQQAPPRRGGGLGAGGAAALGVGGGLLGGMLLGEAIDGGDGGDGGGDYGGDGGGDFGGDGGGDF